MSVTLKLADDDAKLIGHVLGAVGRAVGEAIQVASPEAGVTVINLGQRILRDTVTRHGHGTPAELIRLGFAFDTAAYANERNR